LDADLRLPPDSRLARDAEAPPVWAFAASDAPAGRADPLKRRGVTILRVARTADGLDLEEVLSTVWARGLRSVLCEGGGTLGSALLAAGRVDRMYLFIAPKLLGEPGVPALQGPRGEAPRDWTLLARRELGPVTLLVLSPGPGPEAA
jgi:diaminohydroxyphosphoribosylaminopyrimidine deaminase/5-amino-6-(5-phosphoribosylamino)uracil reductase